jgi:hypothetical protein
MHGSVKGVMGDCHSYFDSFTVNFSRSMIRRIAAIASGAPRLQQITKSSA